MKKLKKMITSLKPAIEVPQEERRLIDPRYKGMTFEEFKKEAFKDPEFVATYKALSPEFEELERSIKARKGTFVESCKKTN